MNAPLRKGLRPSWWHAENIPDLIKRAVSLETDINTTEHGCHSPHLEDAARHMEDVVACLKLAAEEKGVE